MKQDRADDGFEMPPAALAAITSNPVAVKAWMELMSEGARFITVRLQTDWETQQALLSCRTPQELMQVQSDFMSTAVAQYVEQAARMQKFMLRNLTDVAEDFRKGRSRGYDDVPV